MFDRYYILHNGSNGISRKDVAIYLYLSYPELGRIFQGVIILLRRHFSPLSTRLFVNKFYFIGLLLGCLSRISMAHIIERGSLTHLHLAMLCTLFRCKRFMVKHKQPHITYIVLIVIHTSATTIKVQTCARTRFLLNRMVMNYPCYLS